MSRLDTYIRASRFVLDHTYTRMGWCKKTKFYSHTYIKSWRNFDCTHISCPACPMNNSVGLLEPVEKIDDE